MNTINTYLLVPFVWMLSMVAVACSDDDAGYTVEETRISKTEMTFGKSGGTQTLSVLADVSPVLTSNQDWCEVTYVSVTQRGTYTYNVEVEANPNTDDRTAVISVTAGSFSSSVQVTQTAADGLIVEQTVYNVVAAGGLVSITVTANGDYTYVINDSWITEATLTEGSRAMTDSTLNFSVSANHSSERTGTITFTLNDVTETVSIVQEAGETSVVSGETPEEIAASLGLGWNLGNQLDSYSDGVASETAWGNSAVDQTLFDKVAEAGFTSVRIPVTWLGHVGEAPDYTIETSYMDRVAEVVGYAESAGLNAIINIHHDGADGAYWLDIAEAAEDEEVNKAVKAQLSAMWTQIAKRFADKGNFLVFESMNEIHDGNWGYGGNTTDGGKQYKVLNEWNQTFVDAVRATGGNNTNRYLGVPGYVTNIDLTVANFELPEDVVSNRLMVAVHYYSPTEFTLNATVSEWGHTGTDTAGWGDEDYMIDQFKAMKTTFIDKGIPAYIGEMGASHRDEDRAELFRLYYMEYLCKAAKDYGMAPFYWDNGSSGSGAESSGLFSRSTGSFLNNAEDVINVMKRGVFSEDESYTLDWVYNNCAPE